MAKMFTYVQQNTSIGKVVTTSKYAVHKWFTTIVFKIYMYMSVITWDLPLLKDKIYRDEPIK